MIALNTVTQADRVAAAKHYHAYVANKILAGKLDDNPLVQAFAAHRIAHEPKWLPIEDAPRDGRDIEILAHGMAISARYSAGEWSLDSALAPAEYSGALWVAFDDAIQFEIEEGAGENGSDWDGPVTHYRIPIPLPTLPEEPAIRAMKGSKT